MPLEAKSLWLLINILFVSTHAQFAPGDNGQQPPQDVHFPNGNEFAASIGDIVRFNIELDNYKNFKCKTSCTPMLCKDTTCLIQIYDLTQDLNQPKGPGTIESANIRDQSQGWTMSVQVRIPVTGPSPFGTWGLYFSAKPSLAQSTPLFALVHINNKTEVNRQAASNILWCHESETLNYVKLDEPPECPNLNDKVSPSEVGTLTVYVDNYNVQTQPAWTCKVMVHSVKVKCVHLQQTKEPQRDTMQPVPVDVCMQWHRDKSCQYGSMTSFGDMGELSWSTDNPVQVNYNHWWSVCGIHGKPRTFTSRNCFMEEVSITYQSPFLDLFSAAVGVLPLETLTAHGAKKRFKTIAWSEESSAAFRHVCRKVISLTVPVVKTTYANMKAASNHEILKGAHRPTPDTMYQFMTTDDHALLYWAKEKDHTTLAAIHAGSCGDEYPDTFSSNYLVLQYVSNNNLVLNGKARYTGVKHHPSLQISQDDASYAKAHTHTNLWRTANVSDHLMCGIVKMNSDTHKCQSSKAVPLRKRRAVNPEIPEIVQARLDYMETKLLKWSEQCVRKMMHEACLQQRRIHSLQKMQLEVDPSATFSSYSKQNVRVLPRGDLHSIQHCVRLDCNKFFVVPSLRTTYKPLQDVYKDKGVFISDTMAFYRPIVQFNYTGTTVTAQLQDKHYVNPYLTHVARKGQIKQYGSKENPTLDVKFFEMCGQYYIFEENLLVSTVAVGEAGTEQHLVRENKKNHPTYRERIDGEVNITSKTSLSMKIKSFATFTPVHLSLPKAAFYGLRKASYYTQDAMLSQMNSLRDAIAATVSMQDAVMYMHAQIGREQIHSTVNIMGDILDGIVDVSVAGGKAIGGFVGSVLGSTAGMAVESATKIVGRGLSSFMDSVFTRVVQIIGIVGGYWAIVVTLVYVGIATYKKNWNIFVKNPQAKKAKSEQGSNGVLETSKRDYKRLDAATGGNENRNWCDIRNNKNSMANVGHWDNWVTK